MSRKNFPVGLAVLSGIALVIAFADRSLQPANAMTAHGTAEKTMATVPLDAGMEAVVTLDHATGDMCGYVLNRLTGKFFIRYRTNVTSEFPNHGGKYLMATGLADFRGFTSNARIASGVIYVSEESSGRVVAYAIPWNTQFATNRAANQDLEFILLDKASTRFTPMR